MVSVVTGILFGLAPAFHGANANPQESLKEGARGAGGGRHRAEGVFVAVEIGLAVILIAGAVILVASFFAFHKTSGTSIVVNGIRVGGGSASFSAWSRGFFVGQQTCETTQAYGLDSVLVLQSLEKVICIRL